MELDSAVRPSAGLRLAEGRPLRGQPASGRPEAGRFAAGRPQAGRLPPRARFFFGKLPLTPSGNVLSGGAGESRRVRETPTPFFDKLLEILRRWVPNPAALWCLYIIYLQGGTQRFFVGSLEKGWVPWARCPQGSPIWSG